MTPRSALRRRAQERRSAAPSTSAPAPAPVSGAPQRATSRAPLVLYFCKPFACWMTAASCAAMKRREPKLPPASSRLIAEPGAEGEGPVFKFLRAQGCPIRLAPCQGCPGVIELHRRGLTPAPRRFAASR
jgi:hypothetical protein